MLENTLAIPAKRYARAKVDWPGILIRNTTNIVRYFPKTQYQSLKLKCTLNPWKEETLSEEKNHKLQKDPSNELKETKITDQNFW